MAKNWPGINYGTDESNRDPKTKIRYGVIHQHEVLQAWADSSEVYYSLGCPCCGESLEDDAFAGDDTIQCECGEEIQEDEASGDEPDGFYYDQEGYHAHAGSDGDIFVTESPYFTYAQFCSPCAPGACHLNNPLTDPIADNKCYCLGHDWFDDEKAPYKVYDVETGKEVLPGSRKCNR